MKSPLSVFIFNSLILLLFPVILKGETEPNDSFSEANTVSIGTTISGTIDPSSDDDFFVFDINSIGTLQMQITNVASVLNLRLTLFDANGNQLFWRGGGYGQDVIFDFIVCQTGTYYAKVENNTFSNGSSSQPYFLSFAMNLNDVYECNDSFAEAALISINSTISASIGDNDDNDYFKFTAPQTGVFSLALENVPIEIKPRVTLYDSNTNSLKWRETGFGESVFFDKIICQANSTYYIRVRHDDNVNGYSQELYSLTIALNSDDQYECNNTISDAAQIIINTTIFASIGDDGDNDYFKFTAPQAGVLSLGLENVPIEIKPRLTLFGPDKSSLKWVEKNYGESVFFNEIICEADSTYYVRVRHDDSSPGYSQSMYSLTVALNASDQYECNNSLSEAAPVTINTPILASIGNEGDLDYFKFTVPETGTLLLNLENVPMEIRPKIFLYDWEGSLVESKLGSYGESLHIRKIICEADSTYFIQIKHEDNNVGYSLELYTFFIGLNTDDPYECNNSFSTAFTVPLNSSIDATIGDNMDEDYFRFYTYGGEKYTVKWEQVPIEITPELFIYTSDFSLLTSQAGSSGSSLELEIDACPIGYRDYYIRLRNTASSNSQSPYNLIIETSPGSPNSCSNFLTDIWLESDGIFLFANPINGLFQIKGTTTDYDIDILNAAGDVYQNLNSTTDITIDLSTIPNELFFIEVKNKNNNLLVLRKILKS